VKRVLLFVLLAGLLTAGTGCGLCESALCNHPCNGCGCGPCGNECDDGCGPTCGPPCRPVRTACAPRRAVVADCNEGCGCECARPCRTVGCRSCSPCGDSCCDPCADPCGSGCCYARPWYRGPLSCIFALFTPNCWCGPSCGERYWGDFYSDPPDCWDPCDGCGHYTGRGCRNGDTGCGCQNADAGCGCHNGGVSYSGRSHGGYVEGGGPMADGMEYGPRSEREIGPAPQPTPATRKSARPDSQRAIR
jgi:hypothetical protein